MIFYSELDFGKLMQPKRQLCLRHKSKVFGFSCRNNNEDSASRYEADYTTASGETRAIHFILFPELCTSLPVCYALKVQQETACMLVSQLYVMLTRVSA